MKFTWGDSVTVSGGAPEKFKPKRKGEVVGFYQIEAEDVAAARGYPVGAIIYTIEFSDGSDLEIPEAFLEAYNETNGD